MKKIIRTTGMFLLGIGIYAWTLVTNEAFFIKIICAEAGSFVLFCGMMGILRAFKDSRL